MFPPHPSTESLSSEEFFWPTIKTILNINQEEDQETSLVDPQQLQHAQQALPDKKPPCIPMYSPSLLIVQGAVYVSMPHAAGRNHSSNDASKRTSRNSPDVSALWAMLPGVS
jgi:hypothetical protein